MVVEQEINKLVQQLVFRDSAQVEVGGSIVNLRLHDEANMISFSTPVYSGSNFVPKSVRKCLTQAAPVAYSTIKTFLTLDEQKYQVDLHYLRLLDGLDQKRIKELLEEFAWLAEEWRLFLDEHDRHDLIHVHAK